MTLGIWERRTEWPLAIAAALFLVAYSLLVLMPGLPPSVRDALHDFDYAVWALFAVDYLVRLALARFSIHWMLRSLPDLLVVVLPLLRPLRLLRLVTLLRVLDRRATSSLRGRVAAYVAASTALLLYCGALAELDAERHAAGANIETFGTSLWWAITTITTVGYGDHYPVTTQGRFVAAGMMVAGVALLGIVTASMASWFVDRVRAEPVSAARPAEPGPAAAELAALRAEVARLTDLLARPERPD